MRILRTVLVISSVVVGLSAQSGGKQIIRGPAGEPFSPAVKAGGLVYVSGMMATDVNGNIAAQTRQIFDSLRGILKQVGSSVDNVAAATIFLEQASDLAAMDAVYREQFKREPPARTVAVAKTVRPGALVEIAVTAIPNGAPRKAITPPGWAKPNGPYSYAIQSGDTLFMSGMAPINMSDHTPTLGDIATQTKKAMDNAVELLKAAGMTLNDTVTSRPIIRMRDPDDVPSMNKTYAAYWDVKDTRASGAVPGRPGREILRFGRMGPHDVEMTFVAVKSASPREVVIPQNPDGTPGQVGPNFSPGIKIGNRMWVAGMVGTTPENAGDVRAQTKEVLTRQLRALTAGGFEAKDVVAVEVWMTNPGQLNEMNEVYREFFPNDPPARMTIAWETPGGGALLAVASTAVK